MALSNQVVVSDSAKSNYTFYYMKWLNRFGEEKQILVEERKLAIYVELYQAEGKEVYFEKE